MKALLLSIIVAGLGVGFVACQGESPEEAPAAPAPDAEESQSKASEVSSCELERQRFVLRGNNWEASCLEEALPRDSSIWASDGERVALLVNEACDDTEGQALFVIEDGKVKRYALDLDKRVGRGATLAFKDDDILIVHGENCSPMQGLLISKLSLESGKIESFKHSSDIATLWSPLVDADGVIASFATFRSAWGTLRSDSRMNVSSACTQVWPLAERSSCSGPNAFPEVEIATWLYASTTLGQYYPFGRGITWAYDPIERFLVFIGGENNAKPETFERLKLHPFAWAVHRFFPPRRIPIPPVMGDGVSLLYDPSHGGLVLLDPAAGRSWLLDDYRRWLPLEHAPLDALKAALGEIEVPPRPADIGPLRKPPTRAELDPAQPPIWRNTDHLAPWFAYYDKGEEAVVLYPYLAESLYCLPVAEMPGEITCLASHP